MEPNKITIHCSATTNGKPLDIDTIREWHKKRGFNDVGYHMVINVDGHVQNGRGLNKQGAHVHAHNHANIGICLVGNTRFTAVQFVALRYKLDSLFLLYDIPPWALYTHSQWESAKKQNKTCPNMDPNRLWAWYHLHDEQAVKPYVHEIALR